MTNIQSINFGRKGGGVAQALALICVAALLAGLAEPVKARTTAAEQGTTRMFDNASFEKLDFLIGRWIGTGPDGKPFYEEYDGPDANTLRSLRFSDVGFTQHTDGSVVALKDGVITSTWGEFTWRADRIEDGLASFAPVNAPSAFSWRRIDGDTVEVTQNWTDEAGKPQTYSLRLARAK